MTQNRINNTSCVVLEIYAPEIDKQHFICTSWHCSARCNSPLHYGTVRKYHNGPERRILTSVGVLVMTSSARYITLVNMQKWHKDHDIAYVGSGWRTIPLKCVRLCNRHEQALWPRTKRKCISWPHAHTHTHTAVYIVQHTYICIQSVTYIFTDVYRV